ncbi:Mu-like prophage major head subunit gpT family protein [uncultured Paraglaciecola sp.]|uniref:phage major capsid protein n=1 Tax=uncultured Paraglaciecola sp. TaxID=1765024 RepID=UPI00261E46BB|nr:Mu-like prophage major head subunit gpT family protein [uncultured Paraglaciecola sp.]
MAGPITSTTFAKALWPGVNEWFGKKYAEYPEECGMLFDKESSSRAYEEDVGVTGLGLAMQKAEGAPINYDTERQGFINRYMHITYALGFVVTREAFEDDQYDVVGKRKSEGLAFSMRQSKEIVSAAVYNRAFNGAYVGGDGTALINNAHPNVTGGTWSNTLAVASDLSEAALEQSFIDISLLKNDRGLQIALLPKKLLIPPQLEFEANRILKSSLRVGTDLNDLNALKETGKFSSGWHINHYFTDPDAWFIQTNSPSGMKMFQRRAMAFAMDNDFDTENAKYKATERYSVGWTDPRGLFASPGA